MLVSEVTAFLEQAYEVLNQHYFGGILPPVIITVQSSPKAYGHYTKFNAWTSNNSNSGFREINISAENLDRPIQCIIATLIHEMVHHFCDQQGIIGVTGFMLLGDTGWLTLLSRKHDTSFYPNFYGCDKPTEEIQDNFDEYCKRLK